MIVGHYFRSLIQMKWACPLCIEKRSRIYLFLLLLLCTMVPLGISATTSPTAVPTAIPTSARSSMNSVTTIAGTGTAGSTGTGSVATVATFNAPRSVWQDSNGFLYIGEQAGNCLRKFSTSNYIVVNVAGVCGSSGYGGDNGAATAALFNSPVSSMVDTLGQVLICDTNNNLIRKVKTNNIMAIVAGTTVSSNSGDGGQATSATIQTPTGIWFNSVGVIYVTSSSGHLARTISSSGIISLLAGLVLLIFLSLCLSLWCRCWNVCLLWQWLSCHCRWFVDARAHIL